jgi:hypothetical protein
MHTCSLTTFCTASVANSRSTSLSVLAAAAATAACCSPSLAFCVGAKAAANTQHKQGGCSVSMRHVLIVLHVLSMLANSWSGNMYRISMALTHEMNRRQCSVLLPSNIHD